MITRKKYSGLSRQQTDSWNDVGVLVLENLFSKREMKNARKGLDDMWKSRQRSDNQLVIDVNLNGSAKRKYFRDADASERENVYKLNDAFLTYPAIRDLALANRLTNVLSELAEGEVCICNSTGAPRRHFLYAASCQWATYCCLYLLGRCCGGCWSSELRSELSLHTTISKLGWRS